MKTFYLIPLLFLSACSTAPRLVLWPQQPPPLADNSAVRYPEVLHAYHIGRYADPNDDSLLHEQHVIYRVEESAHWDFHPGPATDQSPVAPLRDAAFAPVPVNDAVLAEVNSQRLATTEIMMQTRTLSAALAQFQIALQQTKTNLQETARLRVTVKEIQKRLDAITAAQPQSPPSVFSTTNDPSGPLSP
ncbi:MAG TPA: hypothetical protein VG938_00420 [Verrucomicrobiae bacterium]|jgi:hypothetical protein|nr:hypothetical protein [Verrucomicrobiae bacterium]